MSKYLVPDQSFKFVNERNSLEVRKQKIIKEMSHRRNRSSDTRIDLEKILSKKQRKEGGTNDEDPTNNKDDNEVIARQHTSLNSQKMIALPKRPNFARAATWEPKNLSKTMCSLPSRMGTIESHWKPSGDHRC